VLIGGAPGIIPLVAAPHVGKPLLGVLGVLWILMHIGCGFCVYYAPWAGVRLCESLAVAALMVVFTLALIPDSLLFLFPGCLLWLAVVWQSDQADGPGITDRLLEQFHRTFG
jgi:hypothetical protein